MCCKLGHRAEHCRDKKTGKMAGLLAAVNIACAINNRAHYGRVALATTAVKHMRDEEWLPGSEASKQTNDR